MNDYRILMMKKIVDDDVLVRRRQVIKNTGAILLQLGQNIQRLLPVLEIAGAEYLLSVRQDVTNGSIIQLANNNL